jgi:3-dehydroquinate synthase
MGTQSFQSLSPLEIQSSLSNYTVAFNGLTELGQWQPNADALIVDSYFQDRLNLPANIPVIHVNATEEAKSLPATMELFIALKKAGLGRGSRLVAVGGGVIQDIATFVSSLYMRGITWSYVPTTFLGMADSCLGGKSSINVGEFKNLIGNFHPPKQIEILPVFARTLPAVEIAGGAAEAAKIAFCRGPEAFSTYLELAKPIIDDIWTEADLALLLHTTLRVKQWFIERDEFDQAERRLLNFGHTWGHALESATEFAIPHGLAVALGMLAAIRFAGDLPHSDALKEHCLKLLRPVLEPQQISRFDPDRFARAFAGDKKHTRHHYNLIIPAQPASDGLGVQEIRVSADQHELDLVISAMRNALASI